MRPPTATDGRRVLVAVHAPARAIAAQQPLATRVGARPVEHQRARPAAAERAFDVLADVGVLRGAEGDADDAARALTASRGRASRRALRAAPSPAVALGARARQRLAVDAVSVRVARVPRALRLG